MSLRTSVVLAFIPPNTLMANDIFITNFTIWINATTKMLDIILTDTQSVPNTHRKSVKSYFLSTCLHSIPFFCLLDIQPRQGTQDTNYLLTHMCTSLEDTRSTLFKEWKCILEHIEKRRLAAEVLILIDLNWLVCTRRILRRQLSRSESRWCLLLIDWQGEYYLQSQWLPSPQRCQISTNQTQKYH